MDQNDNVDISTVIRDRINQSFEKLYHKNEDGGFQPYVCVVCDRILKHTDVRSASIKLLSLNMDILEEKQEMNLTDGIRQCYEIHQDNELEDFQILKKMLLSPRSPYIKEGRIEGYTCCESCLHGLHRNKMPKYAIANGYFFGTAPKVLTDLTMVERALLTPVKTWGYCFTYTGGMKSALEGNMTYYKTTQFQMKGNLHFQGRTPESIAKAMAQFEALGLNNDIVIILHGWMTPAQKKAAQKHNKIRVSKLLDAIRWLIVNNEEWKKRDINLDDIKNKFEHPVIIDKSKEVEPSSEKEFRNIEESETFHVFFPDGTMTNVNGGQESMEVFRQIIKEKKNAGFQASVQCDLHNKYVYDYKDNNLVNACLLQFPYGRGGLHEQRIRGNGTSFESTDIDDYVCHLSHISQPYFHEELFCLILYNMSIKNMMLKTASWKVRGGINSQMIGNDLTQEDVEVALNDKKESRFKTRSRQTPGHAYVGAIDTTAGHVPHTNEAAYQARKVAEAIQFEYGQPSWFLTVTPDDDNSMMIQVYSQKDIDLSTIDIADLTEEKLIEKAQQRTSLRIGFPGLSALFFEDALDIVIKDVIGWDTEKGEANSSNGLFGSTRAFTATVEEQGRGTLHVHMLIWIDSFLELQKDLHNQEFRVAELAKQNIIQAIDNVATSNLIGNYKPKMKITSHGCSSNGRPDSATVHICPESDLRCMRHQNAYREAIQRFATCKICHQSWSDMEMLRSYMTNIKGMSNIEKETDMISRMKSYIIAYQMGTRNLDEEVVHAAYDKHIHTKSCFRSEKIPHAKRKIECCLRDYECRYRFPRRKKPKTEITSIFAKPIRWYMWDGSYVDRNIHEINEKRSSYDAFQNVSCVAITRSKLACNTNISALLPSPVTFYAFKYNTKGTQTDDEASYERVLEATKKSLAQEMPDKSLYAIAVSRLLRASFAHQKTNVIRGTLASFLTRKKSRFMFSHTSVWCPISDLKHAIKGENAFSTVQQNGKIPFFECSAFNYLCRPFELEHLSPYDFYSQYEVARLTKTIRDTDDFLSFVNLSDRNHPSYNKENDRFFKCVLKRKKRCLVKYSAYLFPDTAQFQGSLLDEKLEMDQTIDNYCESVLVLFFNYRRIGDIQIRGSFQLKLMHIIQTNGVPEKVKKMLQNILDFGANMIRYKSNEDDLQRNTDPYRPNNTQKTDEQNNEDQTRDAEINSMELEEIMIQLDQCTEESNGDSTNASEIPEQCDLNLIKGYGKHRCGYNHIASMTKNYVKKNQDFILNQTLQDTMKNTNTEEATTTDEFTKETFFERDFITLLLTKTSRIKPTADSELNKRIEQSRLQANGSVESIIDWAYTANLDQRQKRAFEIFSATYIMTFYGDAIHNPDYNDTDFIKEKSRLHMLLENKHGNDMQLICFLHGPAGCGKTTVVDLFLDYAREFSSYLPGFVFNSKTIRVTAMSGTAATLIGGETTHSALHLNQKKTFNLTKSKIGKKQE